jgi:GAF domain-containing protein
MVEAIYSLLEGIKRDAPPNATPEALLAFVDERVRQALPYVQVLTVYRATRGGLAVWHTTQRDDTAYISLSKVPQYNRVLETSETDYAHPLLVLGLRATGKPFGLLELRLASETRIDQERQDALQLLAEQVALLLDNALLRDLLARQVEASKRLNSCESVDDIALVLAQVFYHKGQFVSVNMFERDDQKNILRTRVVATANARQIIPSQETFESPIDLQAVVNALKKDGEWLIADVNAEIESQTVRDFLAKHRVKSCYLLALRTDQELFGFIAVNDTQRTIVLSEFERRIYRALVEQAGTVVERRNLLAQMQESLDEVQMLYDISSALTFAVDIPQILSTIYDIFKKDIRAITFLEITYDGDGFPNWFLLRYIVRSDGTVEEVNRTLYADATREQLQAILETMQATGGQLEFVEDMVNDPDVPSRELFLADGVMSVATIPIFDEGLRVNQLSLTYAQPRKFSAREQRILANIQAELSLVLQNRRLIQVTQDAAERSAEQVRLLGVLNDITSAANTQQDEMSLLSYSVRVLQDVLKVDHVSVNLIDESRHVGRVVAEYPMFGHLNVVIDSSDGIQRLLRQSRNIFVANDISESRLDDATKASLTALGIQGILVVPMYNLQRQALMGTFAFNMMRNFLGFERETIELARSLVSQISLSLQKLRLYSETQRQAAQIQKINTFGQSVQASQDLATIASYALDFLAQLVPSDIVTIYLYDRQNHRLGMLARQQYGDATVFDVPQPLRNNSNGVVMQVWGDYEPQKIDDLDANTLWEHPLRGAMRSILVLPLVSSGRGFGVLELAQVSPYAFTDADLGILRQMANQLAVAFDNADAFTRSLQVTRTKSRANEITARLQQQADMESMLRVTAQEVGRALNAKRARIRLATSAESPQES